MNNSELNTFLDDKKIQKFLSPAQINTLARWMQEMLDENQTIQLNVLKEIPADKLLSYLKGLIPNFPT